MTTVESTNGNGSAKIGHENEGQRELKSERDFDSALLERAVAAVERWAARTPVRNERAKAVAQGELLQADSPSRLAARVNRLLGEVRRKSRDRRPPSNPKLLELLDRPAITERDLTNDLLKEAVIEARDFLSVEFLERGLSAARCVGRIALRGSSGFRPRGTGFLVGPGLLLTNEHVLTSAELAEVCVLELDYEQNTFGQAKPIRRFALDPRSFFLNDKATDFALVMVKAKPLSGSGSIEEYGWLPLDGQQGKISLVPDDLINIIQHPLGREKEIVIRNNRVLDLRIGPGDEGMGPFIHYEADTEKGSSGSPVLNDQWEVVALHHSGVPKRDDQQRILNKKGQVWNRLSDAFENIAWIANEGVRVSSIIAVIEKARVDRSQRELLDRLLSAQSPGVLAVQSVEQEDRRANAKREAEGVKDSTRPRSRSIDRNEPDESFALDAESQGELRSEREPSTTRISSARQARQSAPLVIEVPLRISLQLGDGPELVRGLRTKTPSSTPELLERLSAADLEDRPGFDERFLGASLPLPAMQRRPRFGGALVVDESADNPFELKYHHFSVIMNEARRMAYVSAVNIDFAAAVNLGRKQSSVNWRLDPRLPKSAQLGNEYYRDNDYDRGHLTRRDDAAWGATTREARAANDDTFFYPNAAPQHVDFNQSDEFTGKGLQLWGDLENHISQQGAKDRARLCVLNGPIFTNDDKPLFDITVPQRFFKIVVFNLNRRQLGAVGFLLSQETLIRDLPEERFEVGAFVVRQVRISAIDKLVDLDLGPFAELDRFRAPAEPGVEENLEQDELRLESLNDIVL